MWVPRAIHNLCLRIETLSLSIRLSMLLLSRLDRLVALEGESASLLLLRARALWYGDLGGEVVDFVGIARGMDEGGGVAHVTVDDVETAGR